MPRRIDWRERREQDCAWYGVFGLSNQFIREATGLSDGQIGYRLRRAAVTRRDYRNGTSPFAQWLLTKRQERHVVGMLTHTLQKLLKGGDIWMKGG